MMLANTPSMLKDLKLMTDVMVDFVESDSKIQALRRLMSFLIKTERRTSVNEVILYQMTAFPLGATFQFRYMNVDKLTNDPTAPYELATFNILVKDGKLTGSVYEWDE